MVYKDCVKMRENRAKCVRIAKSIANIGYDKDEYKARIATVEKIMDSFGLKKYHVKSLIEALFVDNFSEQEIIGRINYVYNLLENYGYGNIKSEILTNNKSLLKHTSSDLMHALAITSSYGLDEAILTMPSVYSRINDKTIYALIEELKENDVDVTLHNIEKLYIEINNKGKLLELRQLHPLTNKQMFVYTYLYNQNKTLSKTK